MIRFKSLSMKIWFTYILLIMTLTIVIISIGFLNRNKLKKDTIYEYLEYLQRVEYGLQYNQDLEISISNELARDLDDYLDDYDTFIPVYHVIINTDHNQVTFLDQLTYHKYSSKENMLLEWLNSFKKNNNLEKGRYTTILDGSKIIMVTNQVELEDENLVLLSFSPFKVDYLDILKSFAMPCLLSLFGFIVAKIVSKNIVGSLKKIEDYAHDISKKEWSEPLSLDRADEIGRLAITMNHMQESLKSAEEHEREMLQCISHDLKTPVMLIKSYAHALIDGIYVNEPEENLNIIIDEANRLEHKIKQLLYLNTLSYACDFDDLNESIEISETIENIHRTFKMTRDDINWKMTLNKVMVKGNKEKLRVAFENIMDNQVRYAISNISIEVLEMGDFAIIKIYNDGIQIKEELLKNIFKTLYKSKDGKFGLGLSITSKIVHLHNGTIDAMNLKNGVLFQVKLPKA